MLNLQSKRPELHVLRSIWSRSPCIHLFAPTAIKSGVFVLVCSLSPLHVGRRAALGAPGRWVFFLMFIQKIFTSLQRVCQRVTR